MPHSRALFVSVDGPSGVGKSTTIRLLGERLTAGGIAHQLTAEPTGGEIGALARAVHRYDGPTLACLYTADRYQHLAEVIRPGVAAGQIVITDRYVPSGLVMQRLCGLTLDFLRRLNAHADPPDLAVILTGDPTRVAERLHRRGTHNRYQDQAGITTAEISSTPKLSTRSTPPPACPSTPPISPRRQSPRPRGGRVPVPIMIDRGMAGRACGQMMIIQGTGLADGLSASGRARRASRTASTSSPTPSP